MGGGGGGGVFFHKHEPVIYILIEGTVQFKILCTVAVKVEVTSIIKVCL